MANKIQIKRGLQSAVENLVLSPGEMAVALDTGNVYIGITSGVYWINPPAEAAETAKTLETAREFSLAGDVISNAVNFDGSQNVQLTAALAAIAGLTAGDYTKVTINNKGQVVAGKSLAASDIPTISKDKVSGLGNAAGLSTGTGVGNVVVVGSDGKISPDIMPDLAITDTFVVENEAAMLALTAQRGDVAIRSDTSKTFILKATPASTLANWQELKMPASPVQSVNGKTGNVNLTASDVGALDSNYKPAWYVNFNMADKTADKTIEEINEAYNAGKAVYLKTIYDSVPIVVPLVLINSALAVFAVTGILENNITVATIMCSGSTWGLSGANLEPALSNIGVVDNITDNDTFIMVDTGRETQRIRWSTIQSALKTYFDTLYNKYTLPTMSANTMGGAKLGSGLTMTGEVLSVGDIDGGTF